MVRTRPHPKNRPGLTLLEVIVTVTILAVIAVPITLNFAISSRLGGESARLDFAALTLAQIADASARFSGTQGTTSFTQTILPGGGTNAGRLSHLTTKIVAGSGNACGGNYLTPGNWKAPFYNRLIPSTGLQIAEGFFAQDLLVRYDSVGVIRANPGTTTNTTSWATMAIVMNNVSRSDAMGLRARVEGTSTATTGTVRFPDTGDPVSVQYHYNIHGC